MTKMATKTETKEVEIQFTKEQILASKKYANRRDAFAAVLPEDFYGTLSKAESLVEKFMKGKVN